MRSAIHRLEGVSLGGRALGQMVLALQALAGEEAVKRLHVLLHVNEDQEEEVVAELHQHKWFGCVRVGCQTSAGMGKGMARCRHPAHSLVLRTMSLV